jgi:tetratricopeptide (TPR) repeat protein
VSESTDRRERGALLLDQGRHDLAERELREHLAMNPDDGIAHALLALALVDLERLPEADREAQAAIALVPEEPFAHYARARVLMSRRAFGEAVAAARETIRLEPDHPRGHAALAGAHLGLRRWRDAVDATDAGLTLAPEHETLLTIRGLAQTQLGQRGASQASFEGALRRDPSNSYAHASRGLGLLHEGRMSDALEAFRESLRLDPANEMARSGLVEALKARNVVYAALLQATLYVGRLSGRATAVLFIGFFVVQRVLRGLAVTQPELRPIVVPLLVLYLVVVWFTYAADPLFNLLLRLDPLGRHALSPDQRLESTLVGPLVAVGIPAAVLAALTGGALSIVVAALCLGLVVPLASAFACDDGWPRTVMGLVTILVAFVGAVGIYMAITARTDVAFGMAVLCVALVGISSWLALPLSRVQVRR